MKRIFIPIAIITFLLLNLSFSNTSAVKNALSVKDIMTNSKNPCSFTFSFSKGDRISAIISKQGGKFEDFNIAIHNLSVGAIDVVKEQAINDYQIANDGLFKIEFNNKKKVYLSINVNVETISDESAPFFLKKGDFHVGTSSGRLSNKLDKPTFAFHNLEEGDAVTVFCDDRDKAMSLLKCNHQEQHDEYWVNTRPVYTVSQAKVLSLNFYLGAKEQGMLQKILNSRRNLFFENVSFNYTPKPEAYVPPTVEDPVIAEDPTGDYFNQLMEMEQERLLQQGVSEEAEKKRLAELLASGANSTEMLMNQLTDALGVRYDTVKQAVFDSPGILYDPTTTLSDYVTVPPKKDLINGNRKCLPLNGVMENDIWFFWFGTGSNAKEIFEEKMRENSLSSGKGITNIYSRAFKLRRVISTVNFPNEREFTENIEYALVDDNNRALFMEGKAHNPYRGLRSPAAKTNFSLFPHEKNPEADSPDELFACFCNHNKYSPMNLYFKYYVGTIEEDEVMRRNAPPSSGYQ